MPDRRRVAVPMGIDQPYKRHVAIFAGIHDYAEQQGNWRLIIDEWADHTLPVNAGRPAPYDGIVGRITPLGARRARRLGVPAVNVHFSSSARGLPGVYPDYAACGRLRAEHLLARGFRNFAVQVDEGDRGSLLEGEAFERTVREAGCGAFTKVVLAFSGKESLRGDVTPREWQVAMRKIDQWMGRWVLPVGLYVLGLDVARVVIEKCRERGWRIPESVAMVAGWNEEAACNRPNPSISSLELPYEQVGYEAARLLDRLMDEKANHARRRKPPARRPKPAILLLPPVGIVARRSTDFYAVDDDLVRDAMRFIDRNLARRLNVDMVADALAVSRRNLESRFRKNLNRTIAGEIQRLRIERTKRELTGTDRTIHQIAALVGFASPRTLHDAFRAAVGCTPAEFRKRGRED